MSKLTSTEVFGDLKVTRNTNISGTTTSNGIINNNTTIQTQMPITASAATQIPVFVADPASTTRALATRTPAQLRGDIGAEPANANIQTHIGTTHQTLLTNTTAAITATGDWNNYINTGFYQGSGLTNECPGSSWRFCVVIRHNDVYTSQTMNDFGGTGIFQRNQNNGVWGSWKKLDIQLGTTSTTASAGDHAHGSLTNLGRIGTTSGLMIKTAADGALSALPAGTSGQYLQHDGTWTVPPGTTYTAGDGLTLTGTVFSMSEPDTLTTLTTNIATVSGHTHAVTFPVTSVNTQTGAVSLTAANVGAEPAFSKNTAFNKNYGTTSTDVKMNGTQGVGSVDSVARIDHVHPVDTSRAISTHTHGNISSGGLVSTSATIATGDRLLIADSSASNIVTGGVAFGTSTTTYLNNSGAFSTPPNDNTTYTAGNGITLTGTEFTVTASGSLTQLAGGLSHSTADGHLHVPATSTTNDGKVLMAGTTAGSLSWETADSAYAEPFKSTSVVNLYVNASTGSDSNNGLTSGTAKATIQAAVNMIPSLYEGNVYIVLANSTTYTENVDVENLRAGILRISSDFTNRATINGRIRVESLAYVEIMNLNITYSGVSGVTVTDCTDSYIENIYFNGSSDINSGGVGFFNSYGFVSMCNFANITGQYRAAIQANANSMVETGWNTGATVRHAYYLTGNATLGLYDATTNSALESACSSTVVHPDSIGTLVNSDNGNIVYSNMSNLVSSYLPIKEPFNNATVSIYVNATTGNDSNDGLTSGTPKLTLQAAVDLIPRITTHWADIRIIPAAGTYSSCSFKSIHGNGLIYFNYDYNAVIVNGDINISNCNTNIYIWNTALRGSDVWNTSGSIEFGDCTFDQGGVRTNRLVAYNSFVYIWWSSFSNVTNALRAENNGLILANNITGSAANVAYAANGGTIMGFNAGSIGTITGSRNVAIGGTIIENYDTMYVGKYIHPTTDGNLHVPATSTTNNGKVLTAGATAGSLSWQTASNPDIETYLPIKDGRLTTVYVDAATGNNSNDGSSGNPKLTIAGALADIPKYLETDYNIKVVAGTYTTTITIEGHTGNGNLTISPVSGTVNIGACNILNCQARITLRDLTVSVADQMILASNSFVMVDGITMTTSSATAVAIAAALGSNLEIHDSTISNRSVAFYASEGSAIVANGCSGSANTHAYMAVAGSTIAVEADSGLAGAYTSSQGTIYTPYGAFHGHSLPVVTTITSASTLEPSGTDDLYVVTALAAAATINSPGGLLVSGKKLTLRIKDNGTARALTWNAIYRPIGCFLPTTTRASKTLYVSMLYNATDTKWDILAISEEV